MHTSAVQTFKRTKPLNIFQRLAKKDDTAVKDCVDTYGSFIWALARKLTNSTEDAEVAVQEIFIDIWRFAERGDKIQSADNVLISQIARRRLIKYLELNQTESMAT